MSRDIREEQEQHAMLGHYRIDRITLGGTVYAGCHVELLSDADPSDADPSSNSGTQEIGQ